MRPSVSHDLPSRGAALAALCLFVVLISACGSGTPSTSSQLRPMATSSARGQTPADIACDDFARFVDSHSAADLAAAVSTSRSIRGAGRAATNVSADIATYVEQKRAHAKEFLAATTAAIEHDCASLPHRV